MTSAQLHVPNLDGKKMGEEQIPPKATVQGETKEGGGGGDEVQAPQAPATDTQASLYVGDLALSVDEDKLKLKFSEAGRVLSVRVCRDALTRQSLRYGYVNFENHGDARKALVELNFESLDKKPMRIMWSQRDPTYRRAGKGNLFIKNLGENVDSKAIYDTFSMFGAILSCKVVTDENDKSRGYGFIHFELEESAKRAMEKVDGMELDGKAIYVGEFQPRAARHNLSEERYTNVFVKNFDEEVDGEKLKELFSQFGPIDSVLVGKSASGPPGKAYGFVNFLSHDDAVKAVKEMNETEWNGSKLSAARAMGRAERRAHLQSIHEKRAKERELRNRSNIYVQFGDAIKTNEELQKIFESYGQILSAKVMTDEHGCSRKFGFVCFEKEEHAKKAQQEMNHQQVGGRPIYVAMAQPKLRRRQMLTERFRQRQQQVQGTQPIYARVPPMGAMGTMSPYPQAMSGLPQMRSFPPSMYRPMNASYPPGTMQAARGGYMGIPLGYGYQVQR